MFAMIDIGLFCVDVDVADDTESAPLSFSRRVLDIIMLLCGKILVVYASLTSSLSSHGIRTYTGSTYIVLVCMHVVSKHPCCGFFFQFRALLVNGTKAKRTHQEGTDSDMYCCGRIAR